MPYRSQIESKQMAGGTCCLCSTCCRGANCLTSIWHTTIVGQVGAKHEPSGNFKGSATGKDALVAQLGIAQWWLSVGRTKQVCTSLAV
jgi:hypothetical protein